MVNSFFDSDKQYATNEARKSFAEDALEDLRFLYAEANEDGVRYTNY